MGSILFWHGGIFPVDTKRKNIHGSQVPIVMDCKGTDEDITWHLEKFMFCKVCGISVWLGVECRSGGCNGSLFPFYRSFDAEIT